MSANKSAPLIEVRDLRKWFPIHAGIFSRRVGEVKAVDGVSFSVGRKACLLESTCRGAARRPPGGRSCASSSQRAGARCTEGPLNPSP